LRFSALLNTDWYLPMAMQVQNFFAKNFVLQKKQLPLRQNYLQNYLFNRLKTKIYET